MRSSRIYRPRKQPSDVKPAEELPDSDLEKKRDHLPRKCAVIRRTYPEPGVRKTELRFVSYKRPGGDMDEKGFFEEVSQFLREQMEDMGKKEKGVLAIPKRDNKTKSSALSEEALSSTHHDMDCATSEYLKRAIPAMEKLVQYYKQMFKKTNDMQYRLLQMTVESLLGDTQKALISGGAVQELLDRIKVLSSLRQSN